MLENSSSSPGPTLLLTVEEAAEMLRIGRTRSSRHYRARGGSKAFAHERFDAFVIKTCSRADSNHFCRSCRRGASAENDSLPRDLATNVPTPTRATTRPSCSSSR